MKFAYKVSIDLVQSHSKRASITFQLFQFNNLLGTVYRKGNLVFSNDGNSIISPVGNRITIYDLKK